MLIANFYKFIDLPDYKNMKEPILDLLAKADLRGTVLLAFEGVNASLAGEQENLLKALAKLQEYPEFRELDIKYSATKKEPFLRLKVRLKKEIITFGEPSLSPGKLSGQHVDSKTWNQLLKDPELLVLDTRNQYEVEKGSFKNAVNPNIQSFSKFASFVKNNLDPNTHKRIAMFCTGGIRCEKASSYMLGLGFKEVYQLDGGILRYLEQTSAEKSLWDGECYVFDQRITAD